MNSGRSVVQQSVGMVFLREFLAIFCALPSLQHAVIHAGLSFRLCCNGRGCMCIHGVPCFGFGQRATPLTRAAAV